MMVFSRGSGCSASGSDYNAFTMQQLPDPLDVMRKRLNWRANHRGIKEMDLLVGGFAKQRLAEMTEAELHEFAQILEIPDQDLLAWVTAQAEVPLGLQTPVLIEMLKYRPLP